MAEDEPTDIPSHETVYLITGQPGRTIANATKYKKQTKEPFNIKNTIRASINLWQDLESLCLDESEETSTSTTQPTEKQYADLNTDPLPIEEDQSLDINGMSFDLGAAGSKLDPPPQAPKKTNRRKRMIPLGPLQPLPPNTRLMKASFPINTSSVPVDEIQRLASKVRLREARNSNLGDPLSLKLRNDSTSNESDKGDEGTFGSPVDLNESEINDVLDEPLTKGRVTLSARKISYLEACKVDSLHHEPVEEDGEEERDYGGGPSGITVGGLKEESFESVYFKRDAAREEREWTKDNDITARKKHTIRKTVCVDPVEFGREDLLHLRTHTDVVLAKFDPRYKQSALLFRLRAALVLIQGCRLGVMKVVDFFFSHFSYAFKVDDTFVFNYHNDISHTPNYWFFNVLDLKPSKQTLPVGSTLLHVAASNQRIEIVKYLVEDKRANVEVVDCCGYTPLMVCTSNITLVRYFVSKKANVNHQNHYGITPLMMTTLHGYCKGVVECLLDAGADLLLTDSCGKSAIHYFIAGFRQAELELVIDLKFFPTSRVGYLSYAGLPLFMHMVHNHELDVLLRTSHPSLSQRVSLKCLEVIAKTKMLNWEHIRDPKLYETTLREVLRYREKIGIELEEPPLLEAYENRREVKTETELDKLLSEIPAGSTKNIELCYQALLISDRICGFHSFSSLSMQIGLVDGMWFMLNTKRLSTAMEQLPDENVTRRCLKLTDRFALCSKWYATAAGPCHDVYKLFCMFTSKFYLMIEDFNYKLDETLQRIHYNFNDAVITYLKNTIYIHVHHPCFSESDESLMKNWLSHLLTKGTKYDWYKPIRLHFYRSLNFSYVAKGHVVTFPIELIQMRCISSEDLREYLEEAGYYWLDKPGLGSFPIQYSAARMTPLTSYIIDYGAHLDTVNHDCRDPYQCVENRYLQQKVQRYLSPPPLSCICASFIALEIQYRQLDIPPHIKEFVSIHDVYGHYHLYRKHLGIP